jgi:predicted membrane channel-forming protein YqfA (hemolysin III family)
MLAEETVTISYQMLGLQPATLADDPDGQHDWRTYMMAEWSFTVSGRLIQSVNPTTLKTHLSIPFYLLQSTVLVALTASLFQGLTILNLKTVPKLAPTTEYPYRQGSGK